MIRNISLLIIVFLLVQSAGGMYFTFLRNELTFLLLSLTVIHLWAIQRYITISNFKISSITFGIMLFFIVINRFNAISGQSLNTYGYMFLVVLNLYLLSLTITNQEFLEKFKKILLFIEVHAGLSFILFFFFKGSLTSMTLSNGVEYLTFHYMFFYYRIAELSFMGLDFFRNSGLFWEAGILQLFLNLSLFLQFFYYESSKKHKVISIFLLLTTFSTTGFIIFIFILFFKFKKTFSFKKMLVTLPIIAMITFVLYPIIAFNFEDKFTGEHSGSSFIRFYYTYQYLLIIKDHFIFGAGLTLDTFEKMQLRNYDIRFMGEFVGDNRVSGGTNSIVMMLAMLGVPIGLALLYALYRQSIFVREKKLIFIIFLMALSAEPIALRAFFVFLMMNGINVIIKSILTKRQYVYHTVELDSIK